MLTSPQYPSGFRSYDPLSTQFMTQGQMGYMPQAQYLTSSDYGAYRTMPGMNMESQRAQQSQSMWQAYLQSRRGNVLGMTGQYFLNTYNPLRSQTNQTIMAQRRFSDMQSSMGGAAADLGMGMALPYLGAMVGGPMGFLAGAGLSMLTPNMGEELATRRRQTRSLQNMSMPSVVSGPDMSVALGKGFSTTAADRLRRNMDREAIGDMVFNKEDYSSFMKSGIENNLMDYSSDASQYMTTLKKLSGNIKFLKEAFENKDVQALFSDMKRLQTMGAALPDMQGIGHTEAMFARVAGISHDQMVSSYGQPGALQFTQRGLTGYQGSLTSMGHAANITLAQRSGLISAEELARVGGKSGLTQSFTEGSAAWQKGIQETFVPGLMNSNGEVDFTKLSDYMSGNMSLTQMHGASAEAMQRDGGKNVAAIMQHSPGALSEIQKKLGPQGMNALMAKYFLDVGTEALGAKAGMQDKLFMGAQAYLGPEGAYEFAKQYSSPEMREQMVRQLEVQQRKLADAAKQEYIHDNTFKNRVFKGFRRASYGVFGNVWDRLSRSNAEGSEEAEQRRVGVFSTFDRGMAESLGLNSLEAYAYTGAGNGGDKGKAKLYKSIHPVVEDEYMKLLDKVGGNFRSVFSEETEQILSKLHEKTAAGELTEGSLATFIQENGARLFSDKFLKAHGGKDGKLSLEEISKILAKDKGALKTFILGTMHAPNFDYSGEIKNDPRITKWIEKLLAEPGRPVPKALSDKDSSVLRQFEEGLTSESTKGLRADVAFRNRALHSSMSEEGIAAARGDLGVSGAEMADALRGIDAEHLTKDGIAERYALMKGIKVEEAHAILSANGGRGYQYAAFKALTGAGGTKLRVGLEGQQKKDMSSIAERLRNHTQKSFDKAFKARKAFVGGERYAEDLSELSAHIDDHAGSEGANFLIAAHAILNRQETPVGWLGGGEHNPEEDKASFIKLFQANTDLSLEEITKIFENRRRDKIDDVGRSKSATEDDLVKVHERANSSHLLRKSGKEIVALSTEASDTTRQAQLAAATTNITQELSEELGASGYAGRIPGISEILNNPEQTQKLMESIKNKDSAGAHILKRLADIQNSGKGVNLGQFAAKMASEGVVGTTVELDANQVSTVVGKEDTKRAQEALEAQKNAVQALTTAAEETGKNTTAVEKNTKAYNQKTTESSTGFSLFNWGN